MDSEEPNALIKIYRTFKKKIDKWSNKRETKKDGKETLSFKFEEIFPSKFDTPEVREEKFDNLTAYWKPKYDLFALVDSPSIACILSGVIQTPMLQQVRKALKVTSYNRILAATVSSGLAAGSTFIITTHQVQKIVRGEITCAECHLIQTAALQLLCTSIIPTINAVLISFFSALNNPAITLPIDTLERWPATKEGLRIVGRSVYQRPVILTFLITAFLSTAEGVGLVYYAMKQYRDVHAALLAEHNKKTSI